MQIKRQVVYTLKSDDDQVMIGTSDQEGGATRGNQPTPHQGIQPLVTPLALLLLILLFVLLLPLLLLDFLLLLLLLLVVFLLPMLLNLIILLLLPHLQSLLLKVAVCMI